MTKTYSLEVSQTPITVPGINGDEKPDADNTYLSSVYAKTYFEIDLVFTLKEFDYLFPETLPYPVTLSVLNCTLASPYYGVSFTVLNPPEAYQKKIRVNGTVQGGTAGAGELYQFVLDEEGYPVITYAPEQKPNNFLAITKWFIPSVTKELLSLKYIFNADGLANSSMNQYVYWSWVPALVAFEQIVEQGII